MGSEKMKELFAVLVAYRHNMQMLHWMVVGKGFDRAHLVCDDYTDKLSDLIDSIAEKLLMLNENPPCLLCCIKLIESLPKKFLIIDCDEVHKARDCYAAIGHMFGDLIELYNEVLDDESLPRGMRSALEADLEWFELENNYKNKKRLTEKDD